MPAVLITVSRGPLVALALTALLLTSCGSAADGRAAPQSSPSSVEPSPSDTGTSSGAPATRPVCTNPYGGRCLGPLDRGTYRTTVFRPRITYTVPRGWTNAEDLPGNFLLHLRRDAQGGVLGGSYLGIYQNVRAPAISCAESSQPGVGRTPADLVAWYESVPGLVVSAPRRVTIGGLRGLQVDLGLEPGTDTCRYGPYLGIPVIIGNGVSDLHHVVLRELHVRLVILGWRGGNVTLEITTLRDQHTPREFHAALRPILDSLRLGA